MGGKGSGRKPDPTWLKIAKGNPGKRPLPENEPTPTITNSTSAPKWLAAPAKLLYSKLATELISLKLLTVLDGEMLAAYCNCWVIYRQACEAIDDEGPMIWTLGSQGREMRVKNQWLDVKHRELTALMQLAAKFGFTPQCRVGLHTPVDAPELDPLSIMACRHRESRQTG